MKILTYGFKNKANESFRLSIVMILIHNLHTLKPIFSLRDTVSITILIQVLSKLEVHFM